MKRCRADRVVSDVWPPNRAVASIKYHARLPVRYSCCMTKPKPDNSTAQGQVLSIPARPQHQLCVPYTGIQGARSQSAFSQRVLLRSFMASCHMFRYRL